MIPSGSHIILSHKPLWHYKHISHNNNSYKINQTYGKETASIRLILSTQCIQHFGLLNEMVWYNNESKQKSYFSETV